MSAVMSADQKYRYLLTREVQLGNGALCFVMLNPSTADETLDDPTIRRCIGYAKTMGYARLHVVNLFAFRSTDPKALTILSRAQAIGPETDQYIFSACQQSRLVICAWGNHGTLFDRAKEVTKLIGSVSTPFSLKINAKSGQPAHPLYLKGDLQPVPYSMFEQMTARATAERE